MKKTNLELESRLKEVNLKQNKNRTKEMSLVTTKTKEAQLWLSKL